MIEKFPSTAMSAVSASVFSHQELRQVLAAYSEGVLKKNWKDYAITSEASQTTFCVIERGQGQPMAVIYSISKTRSKNANGRDFYRVYDGERMVHRGEKFLEALTIFRKIGKPGAPKLKSTK